MDSKKILLAYLLNLCLSGLLELCKKRGVIKFNEICPLWELPSAEKGDRAKLQKLTNFKSNKSGHELIVKQLDGPEHGHFKVFRFLISRFDFSSELRFLVLYLIL